MKLLPKAARDLRRAAALTKPFCDRCTGPARRCCDEVFCAAVQRGLEFAGLPVPEKPGAHGVPFLGPNGCTVPPEHRPGCSGFGCDQVPLEVRRTADAHLRSAYLACETTRVLADTASVVSKALLNLKVEGCSPLVRDVHDRMREAGR